MTKKDWELLYDRSPKDWFLVSSWADFCEDNQDIIGAEFLRWIVENKKSPIVYGIDVPESIISINASPQCKCRWQLDCGEGTPDCLSSDLMNLLGQGEMSSQDFQNNDCLFARYPTTSDALRSLKAAWKVVIYNKQVMI